MTRYLALDPGEKTVGCAAGDDAGGLASPLPPLARRPHARFLAEVAGLATRQGAHALVVGLPLRDGKVGPKAQAALALACELRKAVPLPVLVEDESWTTAEAYEIMDGNLLKSPRARRAKADGIAAALILERLLRRAGAPAAPVAAGSPGDGRPAGGAAYGPPGAGTGDAGAAGGRV
ncbi:MAG: Holliday junction resolvase RuvX [Deltaproteobacteria bacterium]|jgi:putative Holliday junction resolvase|nr:Holliday junction resolvase RuvX [Deltaproteobacteria bacterium]